MNLQLALDRLDWDRCFSLVEETKDEIDWIEIGTGVIKEYGMPILREMKHRFPDKVLVADMKTCDAGRHETRQALAAGADITTVMAFASDETIRAGSAVASEMGKEVMVDLLGVREKRRVQELAELGVTLVSLHQGKDEQQRGRENHTRFPLLDGIADMKVAVAGGIHPGNLDRVLPYRPDTVIVGSGITGSDQPRRAASEVKRMMIHAVS